MYAGLVTGQRRFELVEVPEPVARPGTAVVQVHLCGICGTDLHGFLGATPYNPAICGHEFVGTVSAVGDGVSHLHEGDRVVAGIAAACGRCANCRAGRASYCTTALLGMLGRDPLAPPHGAFAKAVAMDANRFIPVNRPLADTEAAVVEPTTVALHAVNRTPPKVGATVVVQGCGPIGLLTIQVAKAAGATTVVAVEPSGHRRALALAVGADEAVSPDEAMSRYAAPGATGADLVFECAGVPATFQTAVDLARSGGTVNIVGLASGAATISPHTWLLREITVICSLGYLHHEFADAMDLIADAKVRIAPLHDRTVSLDELPTAIEQLADDPSSAVKVLVDPRV
jgi:(R,R)-butanediol dehydrogenase / meso-butanediol dehydrogenase / diacetyl reductase